jgi:hypothetical protein
MRRYGELSRGAERSSPRQFFPDCTIAMCGYDFREGHDKARKSLIVFGQLKRNEAMVIFAGKKLSLSCEMDSAAIRSRIGEQ